jgi:cytochrome c
MQALRTSALVAGAASILLAMPAHAAPERVAEGESLFRTRCASCHSAEAGQNRVGPHLAGIIGRKAGSVEGARYSPSLQSSDITWTDQNLDAFLANPRQTAPGTTMLVNLPSESDRGAVIEYLKSLSP